MIILIKQINNKLIQKIKIFIITNLEFLLIGHMKIVINNWLKKSKLFKDILIKFIIKTKLI